MEPTEEGDDRLSSLPDSILIHILSFLPTLDAVRSMVIKRFGTLWTSLPSLDLDDSMFDIWKGDYNGDESNDDELSTLNLAFFAYVRNLLILHSRSKIDKFRVDISTMYCFDIPDRGFDHELESWIKFAMRKKVEVLEFGVGLREPEEYEHRLPYSEFVSDSLIELKLEFVTMKLQSQVQMGSLRVLRLIRVSLSDDVFGEIIRGCPMLNELEIYNCWDLKELNFDAPNVEKFDLDTTEDYCSVPYLRINCPNLKSFEYKGLVDSVEVINLSPLVDATFDLTCQNVEFKAFPGFVAVLKTLFCAKVVKLSSQFATVLFYCILKDLPHIMVNWKHVELSIWLTDRHIPGLNCLLRNAPHLEDLVLNITSWHPDFVEAIELEMDNQMLEGDDCWRSLKHITIHNIANSSYSVVVRLIKVVLMNALVLDELVIYYNGGDKSSGECQLTSEQLAEISEKLSTFSKASQHARVFLLEL